MSIESCEVWRDIELLAAMRRRRGPGPAGAEGPRLGAAGLLLDLSRALIGSQTLALLLALARDRGLPARLARRCLPAALPEATPPLLRLPEGAGPGGPFAPGELAAERLWPESLAIAIRDGSLAAAGGGPFRDVIHLGAPGAADPAPVAAALAGADAAPPGPAVHFVTSGAGPDAGPGLPALLARLDPRATLLVLAARGAPGRDWAEQAGAALGWLRRHLGDRADRHVLAVTDLPAPLLGLGVPAPRLLALDPALLAGGIWSPAPLGLLLALGPATLRRLRAGARALDAHAATAPPARNLPLLHALATVWAEDALGAGPLHRRATDPALAAWPACAPWPWPWPSPSPAPRAAGAGTPRRGADWRLAALPQTPDWAEALRRRTAAALALMRQEAGEDDAASLVTRLRALGLDLAEAEARAAGRAAAEAVPCLVLAYGRLDPETLGALLAHEEHRAEALAALRSAARGEAADTDARDPSAAMDPPGTAAILAALEGAPVPAPDPATHALLAHLLAAADRPAPLPPRPPAPRILPFAPPPRARSAARPGAAGARPDAVARPEGPAEP